MIDAEKRFTQVTSHTSGREATPSQPLIKSLKLEDSRGSLATYLWAPVLGVCVMLVGAAWTSGMMSDSKLRALALSTFAGLSTSLGATFAVVRKPDDATLAFLLGLAVGVMATLSVVELWINNAVENGFMFITAATLAGALLYYVIQPFVPEYELPGVSDDGPASPSNSKKDDTLQRGTPHVEIDSGAEGSGAGRSSIPPAELFRLGILMAITMTLHNMPEGLAVAFSSYTDMGPIMAVAIALHNIPEGIIVAAPIYAATGSRTRALTIATISGLSEPVGALLAIVFVQPFLTPQRLHGLLAFTGGIMLAVCLMELWPEAKKCKRDLRAWQGIGLGVMLMGATLAADV